VLEPLKPRKVAEFPSLSESSGFPTEEEVRKILEAFEKFPSLSESSGFPTKGLDTVPWNFVSTCFHLFQRVVGFRLYHPTHPSFARIKAVSISFRE